MAGPAFGHYFSLKCRLMKVTSEQLARRTNVSLRYIRALEDDRFEQLPNWFVLQGHLRVIARLLGLREEEFLNEFRFHAQQAGYSFEDQRTPSSAMTPPASEGEPSDRLRRFIPYVAIGLAVLIFSVVVVRIIAGVAGDDIALWWGEATGRRKQVEVTVMAKKGTSLTIRIDKGKSQEMIKLDKGESRTWKGSEVIHLKTQDSAAFLVSVNGKQQVLSPASAEDQSFTFTAGER